MGGAVSSNTINNKINVNVANVQTYRNNVQVIQSKIVSAALSVATSSNNQASSSFDFDIYNISSSQDVNIEFDLNQTTKVVNLASITTQFINNITSEISSNIIDSIVSVLDNKSLTDLANKTALSQKDSIVDSLSAIFKTSPNGTNISNVIDSSITNQYHITRDALIQNMIQSTNSTEIATNLKLFAANSATVQIGNITTTGNVRIKMSISQLADLQSTLMQNTKVLQNIVDKLTESNQFTFDSKIKNEIENSVKSTNTVSKEGEKVSEVVTSTGSAVGNVIGSVGTAVGNAVGGAVFKPLLIGGAIILAILILLVIIFKRPKINN